MNCWYYSSAYFSSYLKCQANFENFLWFTAVNAFGAEASGHNAGKPPVSLSRVPFSTPYNTHQRQPIFQKLMIIPRMTPAIGSQSLAMLKATIGGLSSRVIANGVVELMHALGRGIPSWCVHIPPFPALSGLRRGHCWRL